MKTITNITRIPLLLQTFSSLISPSLSKTLSDKNHTVMKGRMKKGNRLGNQCRRTKSG
jgi:hypothetical protein